MSDDTVKKAGRGFLVITAAKVWFLITSAVVQLGLPIVFGSAEMFGVYKIITEAISLLNMVMITGTLQAVSKLVSEQPERARNVVNQAMKLQLALGLPIAAAYFLGSPWIAASFNDPSLVPLLQLSSLIIAFYAFYAIFVGYLNGVKEFVKQATLDIGFSTLKTGFILGLVALGFGVVGAVSGFVAAAGVICVIAGIWVLALLRKTPLAADSGTGAFKKLLRYLVLVMLYTFALNGLMRADLFILKSVAGDIPSSLIGADAVFKVISDKFTGFYGAVLNVARIPYQGVIAITFVIFPMISESTFQKDTEATARYIRTTLRYCTLIITTVAFLLVFNADSIIGALYSADYQAASTSLSYLSLSIIFFAVFYVASTIIIGAGHPVVAVVIMTLSMGLSAGLNWILISGVHAKVMPQLAGWKPLESAPTGVADGLHHALAVAQNESVLAGKYLLFGPQYMEAAAIATAIAMALGCVIALVWLGKTYSAWPPAATLLRLAVLAAILGVFDHFTPLPLEWLVEYGRIKFLGAVVIKMGVMGIITLIVLLALKELNATDIARVKQVIGRRKK